MGQELTWTGVVSASFPVRNLDAAVAWYQDVLGFSLLQRKDELSWCELATPIPAVHLGLFRQEDPETGRGTTLTFGVEDLDQARAELERRGVRFNGETVTHPGWVKLAAFFDPDGNLLMLSQDLAKKTGG